MDEAKEEIIGREREREGERERGRERERKDVTNVSYDLQSVPEI